MMNFSDIYLNLDSHQVRTFPEGAFVDNQFLEEARLILSTTNLDQYPEQTIQILDSFYRATRIDSIDGMIVALRKIINKIYHSPTDLGYAPIYNEILGHVKLNKGGLILVAGATGVGKTTLAASILVHRLELHGGFALTVEEPSEIVLHGSHGEGFCIQKKVKTNEISKSVRESLRSFPAFGQQIFYIGEIKDAEIAYYALTSAINGQLVMTTIHSSDPVAAVQRIVTLAEKYNEDAKDLLAASLRVCVHLRESSGHRVGTFLLNNTSVSNFIRGKQFEQIKTTIERQRMIISSGKIPEEDMSSWQ